ncbi:MAG: SRPBCC domain-containing protein, partial [Taibaiella sp.]|nr:SRPBCC domain-containing protein [Taibaiella sp.]
MNSELIVTNNILINAPVEIVWDILTNPSQTKKYMYGSETVSDWEVGSELLWKGTWEGKEMVFVKGIIKAIEPGKHLAYTTIDPNSTTVEDKPENHLIVTYNLAKLEKGALLAVTQGDYAIAVDGQKRYDDAIAAGGW